MTGITDTTFICSLVCACPLLTSKLNVIWGSGLEDFVTYHGETHFLEDE